MEIMSIMNTRFGDAAASSKSEGLCWTCQMYPTMVNAQHQREAFHAQRYVPDAQSRKEKTHVTAMMKPYSQVLGVSTGW